MRPVSRRFLAAASSSHTMVARARYLRSFQTGVNPTGYELPIIDGDVKLSSKSGVRATLDLTVSWPWQQVPPRTYTVLEGETLATIAARFQVDLQELADLNGIGSVATGQVIRIPGLPNLTPYGDEVYVERGIDYGDGTREWVGLGYFRVESVEQDDAPFGSLRITGKDRMAQVIDSRLEGPVQYLPGQNLQQVMDDLIGDVYPGATIVADFDMTKPAFTSSQVSDEKRFEFLDEIVTAAGKVWYWDHRGFLVVRSIPEPDRPVWEAHAGPGGLLISSSREMNRSGVYNAVVAYGQTADTLPPCRAVVRNMDSASPTYWDGPFGHVPRFFSSSFLQTDQQCHDAAAGILAKAVGLPYAVDLDAVPNPALEPFDPISIMPGPHEDRRTFVVDELTIPLTADKAMSASMRDQSNVSIEGS